MIKNIVRNSSLAFALMTSPEALLPHQSEPDLPHVSVDARSIQVDSDPGTNGLGNIETPTLIVSAVALIMLAMAFVKIEE